MLLWIPGQEITPKLCHFLLTHILLIYQVIVRSLELSSIPGWNSTCISINCSGKRLTVLEHTKSYISKFDLTTSITLYYAFILSHISYFNASWGQIYLYHLSFLQDVRDQAINSHLTGSNRRSHVTDLYRELNAKY